jgi:hypothetical protein
MFEKYVEREENLQEEDKHKMIGLDGGNEAVAENIVFESS